MPLCLNRHEKIRLSTTILDSYIKNFGPRLRWAVEKRGTIEQAYQDLGVSRATIYNWLSRDEPPPGRENLDSLRRYLGEEASWVLGDAPEPGGVAEDSAPYFVGSHRIRAPDLPERRREPSEQECLDYFLRALAAARRIPHGRSYILTQLRLHLNPDLLARLDEK